MATSSSKYIVDFKPVFHALGKKAEDFYFYPGEVYGFIESCVLATQREQDAETRHRYIMNDLLYAMENWNRKEEDAMARISGSWINGISADSYKVMNLAHAAQAIDTFVYRVMHMLYDTHGDLAISAKSMNWTPAKALAMEVSF